jgi:hypothetical protein
MWWTVLQCIGLQQPFLGFACLRDDAPPDEIELIQEGPLTADRLGRDRVLTVFWVRKRCCPDGAACWDVSMTTPSPATHSPDLAPRRRRRVMARDVGGTVTVLLLAALAQGCASPAGGRVLSETAFREHLRHTQEAGEDAVRRLGMDPASVVDQKELADASCKDDLGVDSEGGAKRYDVSVAKQVAQDRRPQREQRALRADAEASPCSTNSTSRSRRA